MNSEATLDTLLTHLADAVIVLNSRNQIETLNPPAEDLLGIGASEAVEQTAEAIFGEWADVLYGDPLEPHKQITLPIDGKTRHFDRRIALVTDGNGKSTGSIIILREMTAQVTSEVALHISNERLKALHHVDSELMRKPDVNYVANIALDAATRLSGADGAFICLAEDQGMRIISALGSYPEGLLDQHLPGDTGITNRVRRTGTGEMVLNVHQDVDYVALVEHTQAQISIPLISRDRIIGVMTLESSDPRRFTPEIFELVQLLGTRIAIAIDNARMHQDREQLVDDLRAFAHSVAHDLKNPITNVVGYSALLIEMSDRLPPESHHSYLRRIRDNAAKASEIIDALLLLAQARSEGELQILPVEMGVVVREVEARLPGLIQGYEGAHIEGVSEWPTVMGYAPWIEEIWVNYISNALKYGGNPPQVQLGYDAPNNGSIRFWVRDNGAGLNAEAQAKLFIPFTRLEAARDKEGHGLGLSIVQRIAERLGGSVGVESRIGEGSIFYFTLPSG